jgi:aspartate oxidase
LAKTEVLIIGCGIAGATAALRLARNPQRQITIITRAPDPHESNTRYAQGGIIGRGPDDNSELLLADILAAGAGVSSPQAAGILAEEGPPLLHEVLEETAHVVFDRAAGGEPQWGQEAAHSRRRILHVGDQTGQAIMVGLIAAPKSCPNITIEANATAVDLITFRTTHVIRWITIALLPAMVAIFSIVKGRRCTATWQMSQCWLPVDSGASTATRRIRRVHAATDWPWRIERERESLMPNMFSFIQRRWRRRALKVC